jgi:outer membrane receptor protein involved in Fe transport
MNNQIRGFKALLFVGTAGVLAAPSIVSAQEAGAPQVTQSADENANGTPATTAPDASGTTGSNQIIVTGSRIARRDYSATSPIVTVDAELLEESSAVNLEANLNKLPQFTPALTQFATGDIQATANNTIGISTVSLRSLGSNRNLVLIDGRRGTPINGSGVIDINSIPSAAVQRVEVITGGASSTYGADAVGGVVNFILKDDFTGVEFDAQGSLSERGDGFEYTVSGLVGASLDDKRGNVIFGAEHYSRDPIMRIDRPWYEANMRDPLQAGTDTRVTQNNISVPTSNLPSQGAYNGLFGRYLPTGVANVARSSVFNLNDDNSLYLDTSSGSNDTYVPQLLGYNSELDGLFRKVGDNGRLYQNHVNQLLSIPQERWTFFTKGEYEISSNVRFIGQAYFATSETLSTGFYNSISGSVAPSIPYDDELYTGNPDYQVPSSILGDGNTDPRFLPGGLYGLNCGPVGGCTNREVFPVTADLATLLDSRPNPKGPFSINIIPTSFGLRRTENRNQTFQILAGFEGSVPGTDWTWDIVGAHGETTAKTDQYGFISIERWRTIALAPNYGRNFTTTANNVYGATATCTSGLSPFLDPASYSDDCALAVSMDLQLTNRVVQEYVEANLQGGLFELPAGQLRFALGGHYRENSIDFHADSSSVEGATFYETAGGIFPQASTKGKTSVKEVYGELLVPVLRDLPFVEELNLELGYRLSDYKSVGAVHTFKINGEWAPTRWLRFRGGYQQASRAPNLGELFTARTQTLLTASDGDPCSPALVTRPLGYGNYSANPELNPAAAQVRALCESLMTAEGANQYYNGEGRIFPTVGASVATLQSGARALEEETAKVFTIGGVVSAPSDNPWFSSLNLAVDYYNVKLENGIDLQGPDSVLRQCFSPIFNPGYEINEACGRIRRDDENGNIELVQINYANLGQVETAGVDVNLNWGLRFDEVGLGIPGRFNLNVNGTYVDKFATTPDQFVVPLTDWVGSTGGGDVGTQAGPFEYKLFVRASYSVGSATVGVQWQHYPSLVHSTTRSNEGEPTIAGVPAYNLFNLNGRVTVNDMLSVRLGIDNLFDKAPPLSAYRLNDVLGDQTLPGGRFDPNHDTLGRRFYLGATVSF